MVSYPVRKASAAGDPAIELPDHLLRLSADGWMAWRCVGLRGAGFPAEEVLKLVSVEAAAAADQLLDAEEETQRVCAHVLSVLSEALTELKTDPERQVQYRDLVLAARQVRKGRHPTRANLPPDVLTVCESIGEATARTERMTDQFHSAFKESSARVSTVIQEISRNEYFREAVTWQNHKAVQNGIDSLLNMEGAEAGRGAERRKRELLVASYLQRYCVKNDTIGFFGPVGWARITDDGPAVAATSGPRLLASRQVYFECWCIDALAGALEENPALRPWIVPRRTPHLRLDGVIAHLPLSPPLKLADKEAAVLWACDGERLAYDIAADALAGGRYDFQDHDAIYAVLEELRQRKLISWNLEVPVGLYPERSLWQSLSQIRDEGLRKESEAPLLELEKAREEIRLATGDSGELHKAFANLESTFTRLTNTPATRAEGQMYAARTLVYEDCRRDLAVELGPDLLAALGPPLSLVLQGARWLTFEAAERFRTAFRSLYERIAQKTGSSTIEAIDFWYAAHPLFFDPAESPISTLIDDFRKRWAAVLAIDRDQKQISYTAEALRGLIESEFAAPRAGWRGACHHSPDVMIRAVNTQAICDGDYQLVLGELHVAANTLKAACWIAQHPSVEELFQAFASDLPESRLIPLAPKEWPGLTARTQNGFLLDKDYGLMATSGSFVDASLKQSLPIASLVVEESANGMVMRTRDGSLEFDLLEAMSELIAVMIVNGFSLTLLSSHSPRITIDRLVVARETWRFRVGELPFINEKAMENRFLAVRRWARNHGLPRFVFVRTPVEVKPYYLDFDSVHYVENFVRASRRTLEQSSPDTLINVVEMLPEPDRLWLPDAQGRRYTSELRIVVVDPKR